MSEIITPKSVKELEKLIEQGYATDRIEVQKRLNISKTQFYDYIYKNVSRVKVNKKLRVQLKENYSGNGKEYSDDLLKDAAVEDILENEISTLFRNSEINNFLIKYDLLIYELYDIIHDKYIKVTKDEIMTSNLLLLVALDSAASRKDLQKRIVTEETKNIKTLESRFHIELKKHNHFRITICGKYLYSIIDQIKMLDMNSTFFREA